MSPRRTALWIVVLALCTGLAPLATDMYLPSLHAMADSLGTTPSSVQLTLTAFLVGMAVGQLVLGPVSDGWGRRRLLLIGATVSAVAGLAVAFAPTVEIAIAARFVQGFAGAAGIVLARATIVDSAEGSRAARLFSAMAAIQGLAPIAAPLIGSALGATIGWRGVFVVLAGLAVVMFVGVLVAVPESLPPERRRTGGLRRTVRDLGSILRRPRYVGYTLTVALSFTTMFAYISGSSFVLQHVLGLSPAGFALAFAANSLGLMLTSTVSALLVSRVGADRLLRIGITVLVVVTAGVLVTALLGSPRWPMLVLLFLATATQGFISGNAVALATAEVREVAGTGSALLGASQFGLGAVVSPLVGSSAVAMGVAMTVTAALAAATLLITRVRTRVAEPEVQTAQA